MKKSILRSALCACLLFIVSIAEAAEPTPSQAKAIINQILDAVGVKATFEVRAAKIPNAAAAIAKGKRYILYNPDFIATLDKATGSNRWAPISILAHEIGHHLSGHTLLGTGSKPSIELEADQFSGFVLRRMGASLEDAQLAMKLIASRRATITHPARADRLSAIENGWAKADEQIRVPPVASTILDERFIVYDVHFTDDPATHYHVTVRNNLVKLTDNKVSILGKLLPTNNSAYPFAFKTNSNNILLVSKRGQIISSTGKTLGRVSPRS